MKESLKNKCVVVTGCSTGIGLCAAETLSSRGYRVIATFRNLDDAKRVKLKESDEIVELDLADELSVRKAADKIIEISAGNLYALFNNGAYGQPGAVEDLERSALRKQFETNFFGTHELTTFLIPELLKQEDARIVQNSSILGFVGMPMRGAYVASKFALEGLTDTMRIELNDTAIKVSLIEPGPIVSNFRANALQALQDNLDFSKSRHGWRYVGALARLQKKGASSSFTLGPETVVRCLIHALESKKPKTRYFVTKPTYIMAFLKRFGTTKIIDHLLMKQAKSE